MSDERGPEETGSDLWRPEDPVDVPVAGPASPGPRPRSRIVALTGEGVQFSLETSATVPGFQGALDCLAKRGTAGMVAVPQLGAPFTFTARPILAGLRIVGIIEGDAVPDLFIPRLIDWYRAGRLPLEAISEYFDFAAIGDALAAGSSGRVVKPILRMA